MGPSAAPSASAPPAPAPASKAAAAPAPACKLTDPCRGRTEWRIPVKWLHLCPIAYTHGKAAPPLSARSQSTAKHLVHNYSQQSKAWWGTFIEVWDGFMEKVQKLGVDPTTQLQSRHA